MTKIIIMFLVKSDFYNVISSTDFALLTGGNNLIWQNELTRAQETVSAYLRARYDISNIFKSFILYTELTVFKAGDWVVDNVDNKYLCIANAVAGTLLSNTTYFTKTDPRNSKVVEMVVDVCLFGLFARLNNYDMPALRKERYDGNDPKQQGGAIGFLKLIAKGIVFLDLPLVESRQTDQTGNVIMYGSATDSETKNESF